MRAPRAAREVDPPDWLIAAGAVRTAVWDFLHGYAAPARSSAHPADIDLGFFDRADLSTGTRRHRRMRLLGCPPRGSRCTSTRATG
jgi:hypothetical protein